MARVRLGADAAYAPLRAATNAGRAAPATWSAKHRLAGAYTEMCGARAPASGVARQHAAAAAAATASDANSSHNRSPSPENPALAGVRHEAGRIVRSAF